jgi:hypothetical protein
MPKAPRVDHLANTETHAILRYLVVDFTKRIEELEYKHNRVIEQLDDLAARLADLTAKAQP